MVVYAQIEVFVAWSFVLNSLDVVWYLRNTYEYVSQPHVVWYLTNTYEHVSRPG